MDRRYENVVFPDEEGPAIGEYDKPVLQLGDSDILVIEGIHGLNDKLTYAIPQEDKFKIYISALTTLNLDISNLPSSSFGVSTRFTK